MDRAKIEKERQEILSRLEEDLQEELIPAKLVKGENDDDPYVLNVLFDSLGVEEDEAYGEFLFYPFDTDEDAVQFFGGIITLTEDLPEEHLPELFEAISYINCTLPTGHFAISHEKNSLAYILTVPLPFELTGELLYKEVNAVLGSSVLSVDTYMDLLTSVSKGETGIKEVLELI